MESKVLNFPNAMKVAEIFIPHRDSLPEWSTITDILENLSEEEVAKILEILQNPGWENDDALSSMKSLVEIFKNNDINILLEVYSHLGL